MQSARTWDDLSFIVRQTGIQDVDNDHRKLTEFALEINRFIDMMDETQVDLSYVEHERELLQQLYDYTEAHFRREEALIERHELEGLENQKTQHARILSMLQERIQDYEAGRLTTTLNLKLAVLEWIVVHINGVDYEDFKLEKWRHVLRGARVWDDVSTVIRPTGVTWLDQEHRTSTEMTLNLIHEMRAISDRGRQAQAAARVEDMFDALRKYIAGHFAHEEGFIRDYQMSGIQAQAEQHRQFLKMLSDFKQAFRNEGGALADRFELAVLEWWISHINEMDFGSYNMEAWAYKVLGQAKTWEDAAWMLRSTGIEAVDEDHHQLVEIGLELNALIDGPVHDEDTNRQVLEVFDRLYECSREHFKREERIMLERGLAIYEQHHRAHRSLLKMIQEYRGHFASGRLGLSSELKIKILEWWIDHTNGIDFLTFCGSKDHVAAGDVA